MSSSFLLNWQSAALECSQVSGILTEGLGVVFFAAGLGWDYTRKKSLNIDFLHRLFILQLIPSSLLNGTPPPVAPLLVSVQRGVIVMFFLLERWVVGVRLKLGVRLKAVSI